MAEYIEVKYGDNLRPFYPQYVYTLLIFFVDKLIIFRLGYHYSNSGPEAREMAFKFELKAADQALSRGAFSDGLVFAKASLKLAEQLAELQVVVEVIEGAITEMINNDAVRNAAVTKPVSTVGILSVINLTPSITPTVAVNKTLIEYQKLKKDVELAVLKRRRTDDQNSRTMKMALLKGRSANEGLSWQPSFIASKRETSHLNLNMDDEQIDGETKKKMFDGWSEVSLECVEQPCCVTNCGCRIQCCKVTCGGSSMCCTVS